MRRRARVLAALLATAGLGWLAACARADANRGGAGGVGADLAPRERLSLDRGWRFQKGDPPDDTTDVGYDAVRPWILPTGNAFLSDPARRHERPEGNPGGDLAWVQPDFDDGGWQPVDLPHDWAIEGPFRATGAGGGMGRLPSAGVAWYRRKLDVPASDAGRSFFLDVDGAMSYATVWLNGRLVGGWPYGYASWRVHLTPWIVPGGVNQLAIRLDNPPASSRWYPGGGLYRNVWLTKTLPLHVGRWGTFVRTPRVSAESATLALDVTVDNDGPDSTAVDVVVRIYALGADGARTGDAVATFGPAAVTVPGRSSEGVRGTVEIARPRLWGPPPTQRPNRYVAVTEVAREGAPTDRYETRFGIRDLRFDPEEGLFVNGERIRIRGVNQHHDLGALGAAFNARAAERQLEILREMGANSIRTAHDPPAPELLELTDRMGFLVMDEAFDVWERAKTPLDFHLVFRDWHEQDLRAFVRRDRNHPSVILWSVGNEVGEQYDGEEGAAMARRLRDIVAEEDPTRPITTAMNWAKPDMPFAAATDLISLNYQGEGIRDTPEYDGLEGIHTPPLYAAFHEAFPEELVLSAENASTLSSRGVYLFPVTDAIAAPVRDGEGGDPATRQVSAYELYTSPFGASPDEVFAAVDRHPFVAGGFVWSGWDYLGEPTPYDGSRSSYSGIVDLAGFPKDRFWLYQSRWCPYPPTAKVIGRWTWPERVGEVTPVHVFTSGDAAELFLNGRSLGRKVKGPYEYRLRWDDVVYEAGRLEVVSYRGGARWATDAVETAGEPAALETRPDRDVIRGDGRDLAFVTVRVLDERGVPAPRARNRVRFTLEGPGEIVATDNGDPTSFVPFPSHEREAFNGLALAVVRARPGERGRITLTAASEGLRSGVSHITVERWTPGVEEGT